MGDSSGRQNYQQNLETESGEDGRCGAVKRWRELKWNGGFVLKRITAAVETNYERRFEERK